MPKDKKPITDHRLLVTNFAGYVLAGGKSSRMGEDKAFLEIDGKTLLKRAVKVLKSVCGDSVHVVLNSNQTNLIERLSADVKYIFDIYQNRGALGGIHAAVKNCRTEWAIILAVDLPFATSEFINFLMQTASHSSAEIAAVIPQQPDGKWQPLCGIYRARLCHDALDKILQQEKSSSVRSFLEKLPITIIDSTKFSGDAESLFLNVNTVADYEQLFTEK